MVGTFMSLVPALVAIILALITKEVYSSLFVGIIIGGLFFAGFNPVAAFNHIIGNSEGGGLVYVLSDSYNVGILIFLVLLGVLVALMNKSGGTKSFGDWAGKNIKSEVGAKLATMLLGVIIFIDDYFNCLTVGSVMRPVTDNYKISRAKLAYLIDATAAPICIIAPISSWAAAVSSCVETENGLQLFINAIPYNYYALFTIAMVIIISVLNIDFSNMKKVEVEAKKGNLGIVNVVKDNVVINGKGKVYDLVIPIIVLVFLCVIGMIYSGGFFDGENFVDAFANSDASVGLVIGSLLTVIFTIVFYSVRGVISFKDCMSSLVDGFKNMSAAILILTLAWTLKSMTDSLGAKDFVAGVLSDNIARFSIFIPCIVFIIGAIISFSTGTSWGTFSILIPIVVSVFTAFDKDLMIISISACMAGAVFGDHCSPISDTTIMSSAGAECEHIQHVNTQLPYAILVAVISFITYLVASIFRTPIMPNIFKNPIFPLIFGVILLFITLIFIKNKTLKQNK